MTDAAQSWNDWLDEYADIIALLKARGCTTGEALQLIQWNEMRHEFGEAKTDEEPWRAERAWTDEDAEWERDDE